MVFSTIDAKKKRRFHLLVPLSGGRNVIAS